MGVASLLFGVVWGLKAEKSHWEVGWVLPWGVPVALFLYAYSASGQVARLPVTADGHYWGVG